MSQWVRMTYGTFPTKARHAPNSLHRDRTNRPVRQESVAPFDVTLGEVVRSAMPFILIELMVLVLLISVPEVATWLPKLLN